MRKLPILLATAGLIAFGAISAVVMTESPGVSQTAPTKMTIGIYTPTVDFGTAQQRLTYVQGLAKAVEQNTGIKVEAKSFASFSALKKAGLDFAIVDGQCYATSGSWKVLANANVGGGTSRSWALYSSVGSDMQALQGKKLAHVDTGCKDDAFIDNAMLDSEVDSGFFSARVGKPDLAAAVAEVASYKGAQAVFAPSGSAKGLTKVFDTGSVPNPAFVQINTKIDKATADKVESAVTSYGGGGAISSWSGGSKSTYTSFAGRFGKSTKKAVLAAPEPVRFEAKDVIEEPKTLVDTEVTPVDQHFERPADRME